MSYIIKCSVFDNSGTLEEFTPEYDELWNSYMSSSRQVFFVDWIKPGIIYNYRAYKKNTAATKVDIISYIEFPSEKHYLQFLLKKQ